MGCSFYSASTHKWLMGPFENGVLYVNHQNTQKLWPGVIAAGWKESKAIDENICTLGQRNESTTAALPDILKFHSTVGKEMVYNRVVELNTYLKNQIKTKLPQAKFITPLSPELSGGIVIVDLPGKDAVEIFQKLYTDYGIAAAPSGGIRFSPHIYNTKADLDKIINALVALAA